MNGGRVIWSSSTQTVTAMASTEAEYMAMSIVLKDVLWLRRILRFISDRRRVRPYCIYVDNQGAIALSRNPDFHRKSKHIDTKFHQIREEQEMGRLCITYVETSKQAADPLPKPLNGPAMDRARDYLKFNLSLERRCWNENK
jgi:hypothetical protein